MQYVDMVRVRNTPQPVCFRVLLHVFTIIYLLLLPLISHDALGYLVIPEGEGAELDSARDVCFANVSDELGRFAAASRLDKPLSLHVPRVDPLLNLNHRQAPHLLHPQPLDSLTTCCCFAPPFCRASHRCNRCSVAHVVFDVVAADRRRSSGKSLRSRRV